MTPQQFVAKWKQVELSERSASQQHFLDLCEVFDHPKPAEADPTGEWFTFEKGAAKHGGGDGWADVWKRAFFGWEYKGKHKNLDAAYDQLLKYREALENPPLLVVCDMDRIIIHTNFTATPPKEYEIPLAELATQRNLEIIRCVFHEPEKLRPGITSAAITAEAASHLAETAQQMRDRKLDPAAVAHFLDRIVFCLFAEGVGLLPESLFSRIVEKSNRDPKRFTKLISQLFEAMAHGGDFGMDTIHYFNGNLFADSAVLELTTDEIDRILAATKLDWSAIDPTIFGTLFVRGMDPAMRSQLGAEYTSREDIETIVGPVVMQPLRREWAAARTQVEELLAAAKNKAANRKKAEKLIRDFLDRLQEVKVLDPACGSGNFLYVTLQKLKDIEKEVCVFADSVGLGGFLPRVGPWQLYGIEISPYAFDLAQMTIWIGWLQWIRANGYGFPAEPILRPLDTFRCMDAILDLSDPENPKEPEWPEVEFVVGNPPFLGYSRLRKELGHSYAEALFEAYNGRVSNQSDLCCYWFDKARNAVERGRARRAGLLATQAIRGGKNRQVLSAIKKSGGIFFAYSDRPWVLEGANVHVSMIGFDDGSEKIITLNGKPVETINANLTTEADTTSARRLLTNAGKGLVGGFKFGSFDISEADATELLQSPNLHALPNSQVVRPWMNGLHVLRRQTPMWIVDFGTDMSPEEAALFDAPFALVRKRVKPERDLMRRERRRERWWIHGEAATNLRSAIQHLDRFLATPRVAKHRVFVWISPETLIDGQLIAFASEEDYFFGILHSRPHEIWARAQGTQVRERESGFRYTPTSCFETFPFPELTAEQQTAIAWAAQELDRLRSNWLNPPEWTKTATLEFPGSVDGPWKRYVHQPDSRGIGTVLYPRSVARDDTSEAKLKKRTLTNLYNEMPTWLKNAHAALDAVVFASYGWSPGVSDQKILSGLLELNLQRAAAE